MYFPREEYELRWRRVSDLMKAAGHETLVIWQRGAGGYDRVGDVYWLTNFATFGTGQDFPDTVYSGGYSFAAVVFHRDQEPELHMAQPQAETDLAEVACGKVFHHQNLMTGLARHLRGMGVEGPVALIGDDILPAMYDRLVRREAPGIDWIAQDGFLIEAQAIKSPRELEAYRTAGDIATRSLTAMMEALVAGETEAEAAARAGAVVLRAGGAFQRICINHGPKSQHYLTSNDFYGFNTEAARPGELVRGWIYGPIFQGYWLDPGRTGVSGNRPTEAQKAVLEGAANIVEAIIAGVRPGVTPRQLGAIGQEAARKAGYLDQPQMNVPLFGHGLGTFFIPHIIPTQGDAPDPDGEARFDQPLRAGMVVAAEAFLTHTDVGTAGFEQNLIVTPDGSELLTRTPMHFW